MTKDDCFVICPIGEVGSDIRDHSDKVLRHIVDPALEKTNYLPIRADQIDESGIITTQIIEKIISAPLLIADLSSKNPNVFYELSLRHAIKKPFVQLIAANEEIPFDIAANRTIRFDLNDLDSVAEARGNLEAQVARIASGNAEIDNPISIATDIKLFRESGNPDDQKIGEILDAVAGLRSMVSSIANTIASEKDNLLTQNLKEMIERVYLMQMETREGRRTSTSMPEHVMREEITHAIDHLLRVEHFLNVELPARQSSRQLNSTKDQLAKAIKELRRLANELMPF